MRLVVRALPFLLVFCSAALLFMVQPMLGKWLLPALGGGPAAWSACLVTFQVLLLSGYGYAHWASKLSASIRNTLQIILCIGASWALWRQSWAAPSASLGSLLSVSILLVLQIGMPYFALSTTLPTVSQWLAPRGQRSIGTLNACANSGAFCGLALYPFVVEPLLPIHWQLSLWSQVFLAFAGMMTLGAALNLRSADAMSEQPSPDPSPRTLAWLAWSLLPSALLLAATTHITVDIAATPLFWVVPLALYLLSYVLAFALWRPSWRKPWLAIWSVATVLVAHNAFSQGKAQLGVQIAATLVSFLAACLLCHGELACHRPSSGLSRYYLIIACGGALGSISISLLVPLILPDHYELELLSIGLPLVLIRSSRTSAPDAWSSPQRRWLWLAAGLCIPLLVGSLLVRLQTETRDGRIVERQRGFLGPLRVVDTEAGRLLIHGRIQHGLQLRDPIRKQAATLYFGPGTAAERVFLRLSPDHPRRIGVVGLGAGTLASYGRASDSMRFYEIDSKVIDLAKRHFSFLAESKARIEIVLGDGRMMLQREAQHDFDLLVLDAFSSDSVPVHLLTQEAFALYRSQLSSNGVLLVNVSNRHLDVDRVVRASAAALGLHCLLVETPSNPTLHVSHVVWALVGPDRARLEELTAPLATLTPSKPEVLWTDAHASVLSILRN